MDNEKQKRIDSEPEESLLYRHKKEQPIGNNPQGGAQQENAHDALEKKITEVALETFIKGHVSIYTSLPQDVWRSIGIDTLTGQYSLGYEQSRQLKADAPIFINAD
ncbi:hypothetical protein HY620_03290 [Candidatus Uhrbacteria bacterium]|nr:hypothetical protein [Candidatus Uhrbacteria bacterium]